MVKNTKKTMPLIGISIDVIATIPKSFQGRREAMSSPQERCTRAILDAGAIPLALPITSSGAVIRKTLEHLDGVVVGGGNFDIHPKLYGEEPINALPLRSLTPASISEEILKIAVAIKLRSMMGPSSGRSWAEIPWRLTRPTTKR